MKEITKEYLLLFNTMTDVQQTLQQLQMKVMAVQQQAEMLFINTPEHLSTSDLDADPTTPNEFTKPA